MYKLYKDMLLTFSITVLRLHGKFICYSKEAVGHMLP